MMLRRRKKIKFKIKADASSLIAGTDTMKGGQRIVEHATMPFEEGTVPWMKSGRTSGPGPEICALPSDFDSLIWLAELARALNNFSISRGGVKS